MGDHRHTPGPWTIVGAGPPSAYVVWSEGEGEFAQTVAIMNQFECNEIQSANARLIAAAPKLLSACEMLLAADKEQGRDQYKAKLDQAITLAKRSVYEATTEVE